MAEYLIQDGTLRNIANAIRAKTGGTSPIAPAEMPALISGISTGGRVVTGTWDGGTPDVISSNDRYRTAYCNTMAVSCPFKPSIFILYPSATSPIYYDDDTHQGMGANGFIHNSGSTLSTIAIDAGYSTRTVNTTLTFNATSGIITFAFSNMYLLHPKTFSKDGSVISTVTTYTWIAIE